MTGESSTTLALPGQQELLGGDGAVFTVIAIERQQWPPHTVPADT